jgi:Uma2 family endonuclease
MVIDVRTKNNPTTLSEFRDWEFPIDGYKYEWFDGEIIKFDKMKKKHLKLISVLLDLFDTTIAKSKRGRLIPEQDVELSAIQMRRPDLVFFNGIQIANSDTDEEPIPEFVIEVISPTDDAFKIEEKLGEYFKAGVKVVWHIYPELKLVYVYSGRKQVVICSDDDICSAQPVLSDFEISANELFI